MQKSSAARRTRFRHFWGVLSLFCILGLKMGPKKRFLIFDFFSRQVGIRKKNRGGWGQLKFWRETSEWWIFMSLTGRYVFFVFPICTWEEKLFFDSPLVSISSLSAADSCFILSSPVLRSWGLIDGLPPRRILDSLFQPPVCWTSRPPLTWRPSLLQMWRWKFEFLVYDGIWTQDTKTSKV